MYGRVLVGTDGSPTADVAVERAVELARSTGSSLTILSVGGRDALTTAQAAAARHADAGVEITAESRMGDPAKMLLAAAEEERVGLIVVGSQGMTGARHVLGSVPNTVSHRTSCHVLIVHTD